MTKLENTIAFCGLFEAELLVELMLRHWNHPRAEDKEFRNYLLESTAEMLAQSQRGEQFIQEIRPEDMNFIAALCYVETCQIMDENAADTVERQAWLAKIRHALPSCFCNPDDLF